MCVSDLLMWRLNLSVELRPLRPAQRWPFRFTLLMLARTPYLPYLSLEYRCWCCHTNGNLRNKVIDFLSRRDCETRRIYDRASEDEHTIGRTYLDREPTGNLSTQLFPSFHGHALVLRSPLAKPQFRRIQSIGLHPRKAHSKLSFQDLKHCSL